MHGHPMEKYKCGCVGISTVTTVCNRRTERWERPQRREQDDLHPTHNNCTAFVMLCICALPQVCLLYSDTCVSVLLF